MKSICSNAVDFTEICWNLWLSFCYVSFQVNKSYILIFSNSISFWHSNDKYKNILVCWLHWNCLIRKFRLKLCRFSKDGRNCTTFSKLCTYTIFFEKVNGNPFHFPIFCIFLFPLDNLQFCSKFLRPIILWRRKPDTCFEKLTFLTKCYLAFSKNCVHICKRKINVP